MNLTTKEILVLNTFETYSVDGRIDAEATKSDPGVSWTDAADLAAACNLPVASVKGVLGSLVAKGLVYADDEPGKPSAQCLTEAGVDALVEIAAGNVAAADAAEAEEAPAEKNQEEEFVAALLKAGAEEEVAKNMGVPFPGIICSTLRAFAETWNGTRKSFVATARMAGFNKNTAQTQWQRARHEMLAPVNKQKEQSE